MILRFGNYYYNRELNKKKKKNMIYIYMYFTVCIGTLEAGITFRI